MRRLLASALLLLGLAACGIKGNPKPPLAAVAAEEPHPAHVHASDAGCCTDAP